MKYEHYTPEAVILANGEYPMHVLPLKILEEAQFVICCDGAANEYIHWQPRNNKLQILHFSAFAGEEDGWDIRHWLVSRLREYSVRISLYAH